jgi:hypothetical protein
MKLKLYAIVAESFDWTTGEPWDDQVETICCYAPTPQRAKKYMRDYLKGSVRWNILAIHEVPLNPVPGLVTYGDAGA